MEDANEYRSISSYPTSTDALHWITPDLSLSWRNLPAADVINRTLAVCALRKFDSGSAAPYKNQLYQAVNEDGQLVCFKNHTECLVIVACAKTMYVTVADMVYLLSPIERNHKVSKDFDQKIVKTGPRKKYIPPMTHPWKAASFRRQQQRAHQYGQYA